MLSYQEIRNRLRGLLRKLLETEARKFGTTVMKFDEFGESLTLADRHNIAVGTYRRDFNSGDEFANRQSLQALAERCIPRLVEEGIFTESEITDETRLLIARSFAEMEITYYDIRRKKEAGNFFAEDALFSSESPTVAPVGVTPPEPARPKPVGIPYSEATERYIQTKLSDRAWKESSLPDHRQRIGEFLAIIGDKALDAIDRADMRQFRDTLRRLPPNRSRSKAYKGKSIDEILAMEPQKTLNVTTVNIIVEAVAGMLAWCVREGLLTTNPAEGLQIRDDRQAIELREAFSVEDLQRIFAHPKFSQGKFKYPAYFWVPLIALFTGMRLEEIAQLHCADLYQVEGSDIWVIDINDRGIDEKGFSKTLKNKNARRLVPVHKALREAGLLGYHARAVKAGHIRLFPELRKGLKEAKLGKQPGKQFKAVVSAVLPPGAESKSFHSLRHTFADFYKQRGLQTDVFRQLYGHEIPELASKQYGSKFPPELLYREVIEKLDYGLAIPRELT